MWARMCWGFASHEKSPGEMDFLCRCGTHEAPDARWRQQNAMALLSRLGDKRGASRPILDLTPTQKGSFPRPSCQPRPRPVASWDNRLRSVSVPTCPVAALPTPLPTLLVLRASCQWLKHYFFTKHTLLRGKEQFVKQFLFLYRDLCSQEVSTAQ